jgi:porphobilinogen synthase
MERLRRLRANETIRTLVRETSIQAGDLIYPVFVRDGENLKTEIKSMPGIYQFSVDRIHEEIKRAIDSGIRSIMIFGIPDFKDEVGSQAYDQNGVTQRGIRKIKEEFPDFYVIADVCLCEYTSHGHCGVVLDGEILNDESLELLKKTARSLVEAGADMVAPSNMMDGYVAAIRQDLDEHQYTNIPIMAYSAKYASAYYGPFRDAAQSAPCFGDRLTYQMDYCNSKMAMREIQIDIEEGADIVMVKPALAFLDIVKEASNRFDHPIATYNVSGEYAMVKAAALNGWIDERKVVMENLIGMKRAGADMIITYHAIDVANWIKEF